MAKRKPLTPEKLLEYYTELQHRISGTPESTTLESLHNLETWAERQGLEFSWHEESKSWTLEPIYPRTDTIENIATSVDDKDIDEWLARRSESE